QDAWQWTTVSIEKKLNAKWTIGFDEEVRLFDNISRLNLCYTNAGISYKINKHFKLAGVYRFLQKSRPDGSFSFRHRIYADLSYKLGIKKFNFTYRARLQSQ